MTQPGDEFAGEQHEKALGVAADSEQQHVSQLPALAAKMANSILGCMNSSTF